MNRLLIALLSFFLVFSTAHAELGDVHLIGHYDNIVTSMSEDPHQYGFGVDLYRRSDGMAFGNFTYAPGTTEGFGAVLYDIQLNEKSRLIRFKAKLSAGSESHNNVYRDTRDAFTFEGTISDKLIVGKLVHSDGHEPKKRGKTTQVRLKRDRTKLGGCYVPGSYKEWLTNAPPPVSW